MGSGERGREEASKSRGHPWLSTTIPCPPSSTLLHPGPPPWLPSQRDAETYAHPTPLYPHPCISWDLTSKLNVDLAGPAFLS